MPASTDMRNVTAQLTQIAEDIGSIPLRTRSLHVDALLESELDDQDRAFDALAKKAELERDAGSTIELGMTMGNMAAVLLRRWPLSSDTLDKAIKLLDEALPLIEGRGLTRDVALHYGNLGWALFNRGRFPEALVNSEKAIAHFRDLLDWDKPNAFIQAVMHAQICDGIRNASRAKSWAATARRLGDENGFNEDSQSPELRRHAQWLREYLRGTGKTALSDNAETQNDLES
jgi:tetratricopeptide (TPR) repeat protein